MKKAILLFISFLFIFLSLAPFVYSKGQQWDLMKLSKKNPKAKAWIVQIEGDSVLIRSKNQKKLVLEKNMNKTRVHPVHEGDIIATGINDRATILLRDGSVVWVNYLTIFKVSDLSVPSVVPGQSDQNYKVNLKLKVGAVRVRVPKVRTIQKKFAVQTPQGTASVRGTEQVVQYSPQLGIRAQVLSGLVEVQNTAGGKQYATRGEKVAVNVESSSGSQTVNQQKRSQVQKNIQANSGSKEVQTVASIPTLIPTIVPPPPTTTPLTEKLGEPPVVLAPLPQLDRFERVLRELEGSPRFRTLDPPIQRDVEEALLNRTDLIELQHKVVGKHGSVGSFVFWLNVIKRIPITK